MTNSSARSTSSLFGASRRATSRNILACSTWLTGKDTQVGGDMWGTMSQVRPSARAV